MSKKLSEKFVKKIELEFKQDPGSCGKAVSIDEVKQTEKEMQVAFSDQYIDFLMRYGGANIEANDIFGLSKTEYMPAMWSVVDNTLHYRNQNWPGTENWYIVSDDGSGNPFGVDPEGKVWLSDHDSGEIVKVAEDFEEFLHKLITDTLWE